MEKHKKDTLRNHDFKENDIRCLKLTYFHFQLHFSFLSFRNLALHRTFNPASNQKPTKGSIWMTMQDIFGCLTIQVSGLLVVWWVILFCQVLLSISLRKYCFSASPLPPLSNDSLICVFRSPNVQGPNAQPKSSSQLPSNLSCHVRVSIE